MNLERIGWPKRLIFMVLTGIVVFLSIEFLSFLALWHLHGKPVFYGYIARLQRGRIVTPTVELPLEATVRGREEFHEGDEVVHPFVGSVLSPREQHQLGGDTSEGANYGFPQSSRRIFYSEAGGGGRLRCHSHLRGVCRKALLAPGNRGDVREGELFA